ncbi:hypothetical protein P153DRAFT_21891 [Dothidotthia symphoricarpi CBS 119687]|uniref:Uncharacterized protein n=1 Tax=Dothidotthia symphoricarpi CBS 119687 TaxID=1392245 RepID=A0A6A6AEW9_9PLEO|nr:uncharacterized protein P153DRAFT_21891 [Dothidotthia symphoricarpi CBS 119687]KAF2129568.1 hypothetical protein P153DRAFT_21891 [Dothidotthia symphoricarpi CBS 119687]
MAWPFGRRAGKAAKAKEVRAAAVTDSTPPVAARSHTTHRTHVPRRGSRESTGSLADVEKGSVATAFAKETRRPPSSPDDTTALPQRRRLEQSPHLRPVTQDHAGIPYNFHSPSHTSLPTARERGKLQRPQSLRARDNSIMRRMSSRRRRDHDHVREEEIRAMVLPMPQKRPAAHSGAVLRRDSKKVKGALNHRLERPTSTITLPLEDSIHSSMSGHSEIRAFRVSAFDMFSPRPTVRLSISPQYYYKGERKSPHTDQDSPEPRRGRRPLSSDEDTALKRTSRIDDLADTLDAGALREILERDKRRRDQKVRAEQERLRRRLERRAEKQKTAEAAPVGLGVGKETSTPMEDVRPSTPQQPHRLQTLPVTPRANDNSQLPTPLDSPVEEPVVSDARAIRYSRGSVFSATHKRGPSNISELPELLSEMIAADTIEGPENQDPALHPVVTADTTASKRGSSRRSSSLDRIRLGVFASIFRRGKRNSQDRVQTTPSEISFSNTSRESMSRQPLPAHLVGTVTTPIQIRRPSSVPRRTMSKFREDLPEFPLSPPDSRVQSPDVPSTSLIAARRRNRHPMDIRVESVSSSAGARSDSPVSPGAPPRHTMSQSLASVDSEGSWLSGKPLKRASNKSQMRSSIGSSAVQRNEEFGNSYEELGMSDDEYFKRLNPHPDEGHRSAHSSGILRNKEGVQPTSVPRRSQEGDIFQSTVGRQPTIINHPPRVKSTQGLLSYYLNDMPSPDETPPDTADGEPDSPVSDNEPAMVQRAKSVDLGKHHVRHLSAGSAKLLDIQKRSSTPSHTRLSEQN